MLKISKSVEKWGGGAIGLGLMARYTQSGANGERREAPGASELKIKSMFEENQSKFHINRNFIEKNLLTKMVGQGVSRWYRAHASQEAPSAGGTPTCPSL